MNAPSIKQSINSKYQSWFPFDDFNNIQQQCLPSILQSDENIVISAPTGSGKTSLFELAMIKLFESNQKKKTVLYLAPMRALCSEKNALWKEKLEKIGKKCIELISDSDIGEADLIISTPEKWDFVTRSSEIISTISLILIDEVHTLNDQRGAVLECIIARMKLINSKNATSIRIIAVSATIPNISSISQWLNAKQIQFPDSMRPIPLKTYVLAVPMNGKNGFAFDFSLNYKLPEVIRQHSNGQSTLIFCSTRKSTVKTMDFLDINNHTLTSSNKQCVYLDDKKLEGLIRRKGLAYHHAGLSQSDRETVEALFRSGHISILCSTSTLAIGVNLPAHLVIIKSTLQYTSDSGYTEYSDLDLRQMIGRAGRAGYDTEGIAVIITSTESEPFYRTISAGKQKIDSKLIDGFIEYFNTEVSNGFIKTTLEALEWFKSTFLYICMENNPSKYSLMDKAPFEPQIKSNLKFYLDELRDNGIIKINSENEISCTPLGNLMAKHFIKLSGLKDLRKGNLLKITETSDLLKLLSKNSELLDQINFKSGDKVLLHKIANHPQLIFPIAGKVDWEAWRKPFLLIQITLQAELAEFEAKLTPSQRSDQQLCLDHSCRLLKFIAEFAYLNNQAILLRNSLELISSLKGRSWHSNAKLFQQINGIGQVSAKALFNAGIRSIEDLRKTDDSRIEILLKRNPPFGWNLKRSIDEQFPKIDLDCNLLSENNTGKLNVTMNNTNHHKVHVYLLVIAYNSQSIGKILFFNQLPNCQFKRFFEISTENETSLSCSLMYEDYSGLNQNICFDIKKADNRIDEIDELDLSISDIELEQVKVTDKQRESDKQIHSDIKNAYIPPSPISATGSLSTPSRCKHTCKDKLSCAHLCCKAGQLKRPSDQLSTSSTLTPKKKPTTFLAGAKRSLANAREYLRKYQPVNIGTTKPIALIPTTTAKLNQTNDIYDEIEIVLRYNRVAIRFY